VHRFANTAFQKEAKYIKVHSNPYSTTSKSQQVDEQLRWKAQIEVMGEKGNDWVNKFKRIAKASGRVTTNRMRNFYEAIAIPRMLYGAEIFAAPETTTKDRQGRKRRRPKAAVINKLAAIQRKAAITITGAMRTTAADTLNIHANILPAPYQLEKIFSRNATRLGTIPHTHPLHHHIKRAINYHIYHHRSPVNDLIHEYKINPKKQKKQNQYGRTRNGNSTVDTK
jgi:hypothetical protein